jgi:hypothetical protein
MTINEENQNERFFDSSTLYKKELKQKQRDILSSSNSSSSLMNQSSSLMNTSITTTNNANTSSSSSFIELVSGQIKPCDESLTKRNTGSNSKSNNSNHHHSNKMLNLFSNLLNRNSNGSGKHGANSISQAEKEVGLANSYSNLKNLKRASSSTQFSNSSAGQSAKPTSQQYTSNGKQQFLTLYSNHSNSNVQSKFSNLS